MLAPVRRPPHGTSGTHDHTPQRIAEANTPQTLVAGQAALGCGPGFSPVAGDKHGPEGAHGDTLAGVMDRCQTAMGSRLLRRWIQRPLRDAQVLKSRYQALDALITGGSIDALQTSLDGIGDVERILSRVALRSARPPIFGSFAKR